MKDDALTSNDQLLLITQQLSASEARYRGLAENLEEKVQKQAAELKSALIIQLQQEKLMAVGQLAAGVAHEINTPLGFITSNLHTLQKYVARFVIMLDAYQQLLPLGLSPEENRQRIVQKEKELKLELVKSDVGDLLQQSLAGAERITKIVADLKGFSHVDDLGDQMVDINAELERTVSVLGQQLGRDTMIIKELQALPLFRCQASLLSQVFYNIIINAGQARPEGLVLTLATLWDGERIKISIADNRPGILFEK